MYDMKHRKANKFLTPLDLEKLNASHLIGTTALKAYMHGYFMDLKAY